MKALNDWKLEKEFRRVPRIADVVSFGGAVKRYEIQPDPERLKQFGVTLEQLEDAVANSNANVGGDYLRQGDTVQAVRGLGLIGGGADPISLITPEMGPFEARHRLRKEEDRRIREIRQVVLAATNNVPVKISDVVDGGRHGELVRQGVNVGTHTRSGRVSVSLPKLEPDGTQRVDASGKRQWDDSEDVVEGIVLLRKGEKSQPALADVEKKVEELRKPGELLPGTTMDTIYDRSELIQRTTHTVRENVLVGIGLVVLILLIFLNDVRAVR